MTLKRSEMDTIECPSCGRTWSLFEGLKEGDACPSGDCPSNNEEAPHLQAYREFLISRIFVSNEYGNAEALIAALKQAAAIDPVAEWREKKHQFNLIAEKAPMFDAGIGVAVRYEDVPQFIETELAAYRAFFEGTQPAPAGQAPRKIEPVSIMVKHWDAYHVDGTVNTHQFDIEDQRQTSGQAYVTVGVLEGDIDDMLSVTMEVSTNPLDGVTHVPTAHVHFDNSNRAVALFKVGHKILVRPETDVTITEIYEKVHGHEEQLFWIE